MIREWLMEAWEETQDLVTFDEGDSWKNAAINTVIIIFGLMYICGWSVFENDGAWWAAAGLILISAAAIGSILWANRREDSWG